MERNESQTRSARYEDAQSKGKATKCIRQKCVCWNFCSNGGKAKVPVCDADLSTGFYHDVELDFVPEATPHYRDANREAKSHVFDKKKKKKNNKTID